MFLVRKCFLLCSFLLAMFPLQASAFNLNDSVPYFIVVSNHSVDPVIINGQMVAPQQENSVVANFVDVLQTEQSKFVHEAKLFNLLAQEICTVTGHLDIAIPGGMSLYAENLNKEKCHSSNRMSMGPLGTQFALLIDVVDVVVVEPKPDVTAFKSKK